MEKFSSVLDDHKEPNNEEFHRGLAKIAANTFYSAGRGKEYLCHVFTKLANTPEWHASFNSFTSPVLHALGECYLEAGVEFRKESKDNLIKQGAGWLSLPAAIGRGGLNVAPAALGALMSAGLLGGAGIGGLTWYLNKDTKEDNAEIEAMKAQVEMYNKLADRIKTRMGVDAEGDIVPNGQIDEEKETQNALNTLLDESNNLY